MNVDAFLSRLDRVKKTGADSWIACCPAHNDKRPSMSIRELSDGRLLVHCFAECGFEKIVSASGSDPAWFFPEQPLYHRAKPIRRRFPAADVLECLSFEATIAQVALSDLGQGKDLSDADRKRLSLAAQRIRDAVELANG